MREGAALGGEEREVTVLFCDLRGFTPRELVALLNRYFDRMSAALAELNRELAAEGRPPLAFGVGINTARVVAGNIGSHRRLNYSVIGDGVNLAARLQTLTRRAEFAADIIVSDHTRAALVSAYSLRDLGEVVVKGKSRAVRVHAAV